MQPKQMEDNLSNCAKLLHRYLVTHSHNVFIIKPFQTKKYTQTIYQKLGRKVTSVKFFPAVSVATVKQSEIVGVKTRPILYGGMVRKNSQMPGQIESRLPNSI